MTEHFITLSTTEPNNNIGIVKLRHADVNSQAIVAQIVENGQPKNFKGLQPFFCLLAQEVTGQGVSEEIVKSFDASKGTVSYIASDNALQFVGRNEAYFSFRRQVGDQWVEQFSTRSFHYIVEKSIYSQPFKDSNYWWTFKELNRIFNQYIEDGKKSWEDFVEANREILESIDPGGKILEELISSRGGFDSLADRLNNFTSKNINNSLYPKVVRKSIDSRLTITLRGDSIFYGDDVTSDDKRDPLSGTTDNGVPYSRTRASTTPSEALQSYFDIIQLNIGVKQQAFSGDNVFLGYDHFKESGTDIVLMNYGINDALNTSYEDRGNIDVYMNGYRKLIERELKNGTAVVLISPTVQRFTEDGSREIVSKFSNAVKMLCEEYNLMYIDGSELTKNYNVSLYNDWTHFNGNGYKSFAARLADLFIGKVLARPYKVTSGDYMGIVEQYSSLFSKSGKMVDNGYSPTPPNISKDVGTSLRMPADSSVTFSFFAQTDGLVAIPTLQISQEAIAAGSANVIVELDFGERQPDWGNYLNYTGEIGLNHNYIEPSKINFGLSSFTAYQNQVYSKFAIKSQSDPVIKITTKSWHTITISTDVLMYVNGLAFIDLDTYKSLYPKIIPITLSSGVLPINSGEEPVLILENGGKKARLTGSVKNAEISNSVPFAKFENKYAPDRFQAFKVAVSNFSGDTGKNDATIMVNNSGELFLLNSSSSSKAAMLYGCSWDIKALN
ncbi:BppU family phage baseplate upper protein [Lactococcus lactis]|uniref:BppU family phage baseplate upper protein n=1 Tax=Lactococcus lactis TaxID=1358 RepID=UPI0028912331|nr:BppU family phage baseplate upper protein [Lactococcus lactis]MDT2912123.1 BppU family phage baseplate upper protein [Lactococcus lactis]MDT2939016.1 BppU family phage baseplate upper protein [Lactococcus lactis]MDT2941691.1 BppU family phage baseplate upper protein [Lactococcus lactis]